MQDTVGSGLTIGSYRWSGNSNGLHLGNETEKSGWKKKKVVELKLKYQSCEKAATVTVTMDRLYLVSGHSRGQILHSATSLLLLTKVKVLTVGLRPRTIPSIVCYIYDFFFFAVEVYNEPSSRSRTMTLRCRVLLQCCCSLDHRHQQSLGVLC